MEGGGIRGRELITSHLMRGSARAAEAAKTTKEVGTNEGRGKA